MVGNLNFNDVTVLKKFFLICLKIDQYNMGLRLEAGWFREIF